MPPGGPHFQPPYGPPPPGYPAQQGYPPPNYGYAPPGYPPPAAPQHFAAPPPAAYGPPAGHHVANGPFSTSGVASGPFSTSGVASGSFSAPGVASGSFSTPNVANGPFSTPNVANGPFTTPNVPNGPFGAAGPGAGGPPVVIDVGGTNARKAVIGASVAGLIGLVAVVSAIVGAVDGGGGGAAVAAVIGLLFLLLPVGLVARRDKIFRPQHLVFEPGGLRWSDPKGAPWMVAWSELAAVSVSKHSAAQVGPESISDKLSGAAADKIVGERAHVRLDIYPADPAFAGRHPEMAHLWERQGVQNGYRLPLGSNVKFIPMIAAAMGRFAPHIYRGVNATEGFMGLS